MKYTKEQRELLKKWKRLAESSNTRLRYGKPRKLSTQTFNRLLAFREEEEYPEYRESADEGIASHIRRLEKQIESLPQCIKELDVEPLVKQKMEEIFSIGNSASISDEKEWRKSHGYPEEDPKYIFYDMIEENCPKDVLEKHTKRDGPYAVFNPRYSFDLYLDLEIEKNYECVVEPDSTLEKMKKNPYCDYSEGFYSFIDDKIHEWEKGARQSKRDKWTENYLPNDVAKKYREELIKLTNRTDVRETLEKMHEDLIKSRAKTLLELYKNEPSSSDKDTYWEWKRKVGNLFEYQKFLNDSKSKIDVKKIKEEARSTADAVISKFVLKNTEKIGPILGKRPDCNKMTPNISVRGGVIQGVINVDCENGDRFSVWQDLVMVVHGLKYSRPFYRYPTTFHDVVYNGERYKKVSEKWMNTVFAKKSKKM